MKEYILLTGASSGIGYEMAVQLAAKNCNLILVARNRDKLKQMQKELEEKYAIEVDFKVKDLSDVENAMELYNELKHENYLINGLINNAGVGVYGQFSKSSLSEELKMIELNISSLVTLTKLFLKDMLERKSGRIMNVASLLSFLPFPYYSVYSATKCFVLSFTETLAAELEGTGVTLTALCPGPVDTPFQTDAMWKTKAYKANKPVSPETVAKAGVRLFLYGKGKKVVGFMNRFLSNLPRVTPDSIMMKIKKNLASQNDV